MEGSGCLVYIQSCGGPSPFPQLLERLMAYFSHLGVGEWRIGEERFGVDLLLFPLDISSGQRSRACSLEQLSNTMSCGSVGTAPRLAHHTVPLQVSDPREIEAGAVLATQRTVVMPGPLS